MPSERRRDCQCLRARHQHGTRGAWARDRCRCLPCCIASSTAECRARAGETGTFADPNMWVPACGMIRRLQALHRIGWTTGDLAAHLGVTYDAVRNMRRYPSPRRSIWLAARVAALYDQLWDQTPTPRGRGHAAMISRTINEAVREGWAPPLAWDDDTIDDPDAQACMGAEHDPEIDELAVDEALHGHRVQLPRAERDVVVAILTDRGVPAHEISRRLGVTERTVTRRRAAA